MRAAFLGCPIDVFSMDILNMAETVELARAAMHDRQRVQHVALNVACGRERAVGLTALPAATYTRGMTSWAAAELQL